MFPLVFSDCKHLLQLGAVSYGSKKGTNACLKENTYNGVKVHIFRRPLRGSKRFRGDAGVARFDRLCRRQSPATTASTTARPVS